MRIGIAGVGKMGSAIALRLLEAGHEVWVWNRTAAKVEPLRQAGAQVAPTAAALAGAVEVIITILSNAAAQEGTYDGPSGVLAGNVNGKLVIDMSTVRPGDAQALARKVTGKRAAFVECPVGGTTGPARQGKLLGLAGGDAADLARAQPILAQLCRRLEHVGPIGAGASMKLAINLPLLVAYQALGEAFILCRHLSIDPKALMELFADTSGAPNVLKVRGPAVAEALAGGPGIAATFDVDSIRKDLNTMIAEAEGRGANLPLAERTLAIFDEAAREGWGGRDGSSLPSYWPKRTPA
ncbi:MAG TPA: NAD(P)-dependent oxidoreductase [Hyphomicrobiaceae bacterium]|nr:NAD(P)-dependent oxidoreductase [Hyphomicrobiaceae bacterium]